MANFILATFRYTFFFNNLDTAVNLTVTVQFSANIMLIINIYDWHFPFIIPDNATYHGIGGKVVSEAFATATAHTTHAAHT